MARVALTDDNGALYGAPATWLTGRVTNPDGYDVILLAGQSNMSGRGTGHTAATDPGHPLVYQYGFKTKTLRAASEPLDMSDTPTGIGPGFQFARRYIAEGLNRGRKVLLVPTAHGGTPLVSGETWGWRYSVEGSRARLAATQTLDALTAAGPGSRLVAILWVQGETDSDNNVTGTAYQADLDALITGFRAGLNAPQVPFVIGGMVPEYLSTKTRAQIDAVHKATPTRVAFTGFGAGPMGANRGDGNHYNIDGYRLLAKSMFEAYKRAVSGLIPDPVGAGIVDPTVPVPPAETLGVLSAAQAYSLRTVTAGYTGPLVKVSRSTDSELLDVYATGGALDQATLLSFAGSGSAYVHTWFDQSGNGRHITQATAAARPTIVDAGTLVTSAGKPAVRFDGTDDHLFNTTPVLYTAGGATVAAVINAANPASQRRWWAEANSTLSTQQYGLHQPDEINSANRVYARPVITSDGAGGGVDSGLVAFRGALSTFDGTPHQITATDSGTQLAQWVDGAVDLAPATYTRYASTKDRFAVGGVVRSGSLAAMPMTLSEVVFWGAPLASGDRVKVEGAQKSFYTTP